MVAEDLEDLSIAGAQIAERHRHGVVPHPVRAEPLALHRFVPRRQIPLALLPGNPALVPGAVRLHVLPELPEHHAARVRVRHLEAFSDLWGHSPSQAGIVLAQRPGAVEIAGALQGDLVVQMGHPVLRKSALRGEELAIVADRRRLAHGPGDAHPGLRFRADVRSHLEGARHRVPEGDGATLAREWLSVLQRGVVTQLQGSG